MYCIRTVSSPTQSEFAAPSVGSRQQSRAQVGNCDSPDWPPALEGTEYLADFDFVGYSERPSRSPETTPLCAPWSRGWSRGLRPSTSGCHTSSARHNHNRESRYHPASNFAPRDGPSRYRSDHACLTLSMTMATLSRWSITLPQVLVPSGLARYRHHAWSGSDSDKLSQGDWTKSEIECVGQR